MGFSYSGGFITAYECQECLIYLFEKPRCLKEEKEIKSKREKKFAIEDAVGWGSGKEGNGILIVRNVYW